jgi:hypothetical protein
MGYTSTHQNDTTALSSMFPVVFVGDRFNDEQIFGTIRHEVIHYFLGIHYRNYSDDSALFHLVCLLFDGKEYKELNNDEKENPFVSLMASVKPEIDLNISEDNL